MRCTGILVVCALTIGCAPGGAARRQSMSPLRHTGSELIHGSGLRAQDQSIRHPPPVVTPDPPAAARESPPEFSYDLYSDKQGHFSYDGAALALVQRPSHLQRVYADAARGEARPKRLIQELEYWFQQTGLAVADRTAALGCVVLPELQSNCRPPNWEFIEQFLGNSLEGVRLREVLAEAYARRAHQLGVRNDVTVAGVNLLLVGSLANAVLARVGVVEARTAVQKSLLPEAKAAGGVGRLLGNALQPFKGGSLTQAGRALTKHPEVLGYTKGTLRTALRTDPEINAGAAGALGDILKGTQTAVTLPRYGAVLEFRGASGFGARFYAETGEFIGFINP